MTIPAELEKHIDEIITHYPPQHKRAAVLWLLHLLQEQFGYLGKEQVEWTATKLGLQPINVWELVTFYPMFTSQTARQVPHQGLPHALVRTLRLRRHSRTLAEETRRRPGREHADGLFTISTVECLAACGTGPVMMVNDELFENLTPEKAEAIIDRIKTTGQIGAATVAAAAAAGASAGETRPAGQHQQARLHGLDRRLRTRRRLSARCAKRSA